jgi:hypothetical protein
MCMIVHTHIYVRLDIHQYIYIFNINIYYTQHILKHIYNMYTLTHDETQVVHAECIQGMFPTIGCDVFWEYCSSKQRSSAHLMVIEWFNNGLLMVNNGMTMGYTILQTNIDVMMWKSHNVSISFLEKPWVFHIFLHVKTKGSSWQFADPYWTSKAVCPVAGCHFVRLSPLYTGWVAHNLAIEYGGW